MNEGIMGLDMQWEDEWGKPFAAFPDTRGVFASILATRPLDHTICLRFIDDYGDTVFNWLQVPVLVAELQALIVPECAPEANDRLAAMIEFIQAMPQDKGAYLKFYGD